METESFQPQLIPLTRWKDGTIRIGNTRVLLDLVVYEFNTGKSPEEIVLSYPTLSLPEVYSTIAYYLEHQSTLDAYIQSRQTAGDLLDAKLKQSPHQQKIRQKLLEQRKNLKN